jgi:hypothetical protein
MPGGISPRKRGRGGCLGCVGQVVAILLGGVLLIWLLTAVLFPWAFFLGGNFHVVPMWTGLGKLHAKSGDYVVYVQIEPTPEGSRIIAESNLKRLAYLCTPRGEKFSMNLGGSMRAHLNLSTDGEGVSLYMNNWPPFTGAFLTDHRPSIELRGRWQDPNLVADDHGSIGRAFQSDGTVYSGHDRNRPYMSEILPVTLAPGSHSDFNAACSALHR